MFQCREKRKKRERERKKERKEAHFQATTDMNKFRAIYAIADVQKPFEKKKKKV